MNLLLDLRLGIFYIYTYMVYCTIIQFWIEISIYLYIMSV